MGSWYQDTTRDCYPGVYDQGQGLCFNIEIQFLFNNKTGVCLYIFTPNSVHG